MTFCDTPIPLAKDEEYDVNIFPYAIFPCLMFKVHNQPLSQNKMKRMVLQTVP